MGAIFFKKNFKFVAHRYEEWEGGKCTFKGPISTTILAEDHEEHIHFELDDVSNIYIVKSFDFEYVGSEILEDRIQYIHSSLDMNPVIPVICHLFYNDETITYVRFTMTNPDRIIEFYGKLVEINQPSSSMKSKSENEEKISAQSILNQLNVYDMLNTEAIMERAVNLYNKNANVRTLSQAKTVIECLKLFIKAFQFDREENEGEKFASMLKPKILMFIALCNYKIYNINQAYCLAKQGLDAVDDAIENSPFSGISKSMLGADTLKEIINTIEKNHFSEVKDKDNYYDIDPEEFDTTKFDEILSKTGDDFSKPSKEHIKRLIDFISKVQSNISSKAEKKGNVAEASKTSNFFEMFKIPLYYVWQGYKYGWHTDFCKEGDSMFQFMFFEANMEEILSSLIDVLKTHSPFAPFEEDSIITEALISLYDTFLNKLKEGSIKF